MFPRLSVALRERFAVLMCDGTETGHEMTDAETTTTDAGDAGTVTGGEQKQQEQTFTQADVDRIVKERIQRVETKYADYTDLKAKAEGAKTVEQKLAELEAKHAETEARALRSDIAAKHGLTAEDRDLFLTGADEATLTAQAQRLAERIAAVKKQGNVAPNEGETKSTGKPEEQEVRELAGNLFGRSD